MDGRCHAEFISASRISNMLQVQEILKRVQDDNYQPACLPQVHLFLKAII
jgi:hypothetical protein